MNSLVLRVARRVVAVVVEAGLADRDDFRMVEQALELAKSTSLAASWGCTPSERRRRRALRRAASDFAQETGSVPTVDDSSHAGVARAGDCCRGIVERIEMRVVSITTARDG